MKGRIRTYPQDCTLPTEFLGQLAAVGLEGLPEVIRMLVTEAMRLGRQTRDAVLHGLGQGRILQGMEEGIRAG